MITKDSESWNDIAVPALVAETSNDLVCGYHLAVLRAHPEVLSGRYLFRAIQSRPVATQLEPASTGVTRFGLPKGAIGSALIPAPPLPEHRRIADYLDRETARIDELVAAKESMLRLLEEKRSALISRCVTGGIDLRAFVSSCETNFWNGTRRHEGIQDNVLPYPHYKPSGLDWLGEIPAHWGQQRSKRLLIERDERSQTGEEEMLTVSHLTGVTPRSEKDVKMFEAESNEG